MKVRGLRRAMSGRMRIEFEEERGRAEGRCTDGSGERRLRRDGIARSVVGGGNRRIEELSAVLAGVEADAPAESARAKIRQVACDSRKVQAGSLFFALHGAKTDGNAFVRDAVERGAAAIASEEDASGGFAGRSVAWVRVREARKALARRRRIFSGIRRTRLKMVAVTGTNGKTTTTSLIDAIVKASGAKTGLFGTIAYHTPRGEYPAPNTTPESVDLQGALAEVRDAGGKYAVLEASSHSLAMDRLVGLPFRGGGVHESDARAHGLSQDVRGLLRGEEAAV